MPPTSPSPPTTLSTLYSTPSDPDAHFDLLDDASLNYPDLRAPIPKTAHFIYTTGAPLSWIQWLAIRAAIIHLGCPTVRIWIPAESLLEGPLWEAVVGWSEVSIERIVLPTSVYGVKTKDSGQSADLAKLKILWEQGGIYLENDLIALKSSDDVLNSTSKATIMAERSAPAGVPNWMIMSKPASPFLMRWMEEYAEERDFATLATVIPLEFFKNRDPDVHVLGGRTWFYPLASDGDGDMSLKKLWFGKSWYDVGSSYGTHVWHWSEEIRGLVTPELVRLVDTPLFCRLRGLFDGVGDGVEGESWERDEWCNVTTIPDLGRKRRRLFLDWRAEKDGRDVKMRDQSGYHNHGWAVSGTELQNGYREFAQGSYAVLPVPVGWDARVFTLHTRLRVDPSCLASTEATSLMKVRMENEDELLIQFRTQRQAPALDIHWESVKKDKYHKNEDFSWVSPSRLTPLTEQPHDLTISFDRRDNGSISVYLDGQGAGGQDLPLVYSPKIGQEIWLNARHWDDLDTGFRGELYRFTMFADAIGPEEIAEVLGDGRSSSRFADLRFSIQSWRVSSTPMFLLPILLVLLLLGFSIRQGRTLRRDLAEVGKVVVEVLRKATGGRRLA